MNNDNEETYKVYQYEIDVNHLVPNDGKNYGSELNLHGRITPEIRIFL